MNEQAHTPEPWTVQDRASWWSEHPHYKEMACVISGQSTLPLASAGETWEIAGLQIAEQSEPPDNLDIQIMALGKANGARIVACVNACAGIPNPAELRRQRDECLAALKVILMVHIPSGGGHSMVSDSSLAQARAAIARCEGMAGT